ncbi:MAG: Na(+)/H(+) antiporter subunit B [Spirochaetaceae bacterium]
MIRRILAFAVIVMFAVILYPLAGGLSSFTSLSPVAEAYATEGPDDLGAANLVTAVIVTYRGLDTLGEVTVLFIATAGVGFLLRKERTGKGEGDSGEEHADSKSSGAEKRGASEILETGSMFLLPILLLFAVYIFLHGHLTPGGGFQGGVVIAAGMLLLMLSRAGHRLNHLILTLLESISGFAYVLIGVAGIFLAAGFLDNSILPLGKFGSLMSAGAIPLIYSLIGLKVGTELTNILDTMKKE